MTVVAQGVDYANARLTGEQLKAADKEFVVRYLSPDTDRNPGKRLERSEVDSFEAAGIKIVLVWETSPSRATQGFSAGVADAKAAEVVRKNLGLPVQPIYFVAQDEADVTGPHCVRYFQGVASVVGLGLTGQYSGYAVTKYLFDRNLVTYGWQTYAWSGGQWDERAQLQQYHNGVLVAGQRVDLCRAMKADYGQYTPLIQEDDMSDAQVQQILNAIEGVSVAVAHGAPQYDPKTPGDPTSYQHTLSAVVDGLQGDLATIRSQVASVGSQIANLASVVTTLATNLQPAAGGGVTVDEVKAIVNGAKVVAS